MCSKLKAQLPSKWAPGCTVLLSNIVINMGYIVGNYCYINVCTYYHLLKLMLFTVKVK